MIPSVRCSLAVFAASRAAVTLGSSVGVAGGMSVAVEKRDAVFCAVAVVAVLGLVDPPPPGEGIGAGPKFWKLSAGSDTLGCDGAAGAMLPPVTSGVVGARTIVAGAGAGAGAGARVIVGEIAVGAGAGARTKLVEMAVETGLAAGLGAGAGAMVGLMDVVSDGAIPAPK